MNLKTFVFLLTSSCTFGFAIVFALTMLISEGKANINYYGEGWIETGILGIIGIAGFYYLRK